MPLPDHRPNRPLLPAMIVVGLAYGGLSTHTNAQRVLTKDETAAVAALALVCVDKFIQANNAAENISHLNATGESTTDKATYIVSGGWATFAGNSEPNFIVAQACADALSN